MATEQLTAMQPHIGCRLQDGDKPKTAFHRGVNAARNESSIYSTTMLKMLFVLHKREYFHIHNYMCMSFQESLLGNRFLYRDAAD